MKKRYLSLFLLFALLFTSLPLAAGAKEEILNPSESDNLADKGYVEDTYLYSNEFSTDFGHTSSNTPGSWQSTWGSTVSGVVDPTDSENKVGSVMVTGDKTITKGYLEAKNTLVVSVSIYIPAPQQGNYPSAFSVKLSGKSVLKLTYDSVKDAYAFTMGTASGFVPKESWMSFSTVMTADTELGWEKAHLSSQLSGVLTDSEGNAQTFVKGEAEIAYTNPQCQFNANVDASSVAGYYLDNFKVYVPGDFGNAKITMPKANDGFDNVILDEKVAVRLLHTPDLATFSPENVRIYNEYGTEIPYTALKYDIAKPDRMTIDFSQNPLPTFSMLYLDVGEGVKDLQGKEINKRYAAFETFGRVGQRPISQPLIMPPEGGFVMPDKYNTGYRCDESELIPFAEKYSDIPVAANGEVRINESLAKKYNYEFSHFSLEGSFIITATSPVHFHDFFLDVPGHYGFQNQGCERLYITNATCTGSQSAMFGGRTYLEKIYCYDVPGDHLKGSSYQTSVSCYFTNGGYMNPEAHADANQISMFDAESRVTKDMYMVGCRIDVPNLPGTVGNSAAIFLAPERTGPYGLANYQLSHNWFNGSAGTVRLGKGQHAEGLFEYVTYAYNRLGYGYQHYAENIVLNKTELANYGNGMCDSLDVGSVVYYDAQSNRVQTLSEMTEGGTVLVNFANYTKVARDFSLEIALKDAQGSVVATFGKDGTVRRYIPYGEYTQADNMTTAVIGGKTYNVLIELPDQPENVGEVIEISGLPADLSGYRLEVLVKEGDTLLRTSTLTDAGIKENEGFARSYQVAFTDKDGVVLRYLEVYEGQPVPASAIPEAPVLEGRNFLGWSKDLSSVTANMTVKATYDGVDIPEPETYTVTFYGKDGEVLKTETVESGNAATAPIAPPIDGYTFTGWSADFSAVTNDLTVRALYEQNQTPTPDPTPDPEPEPEPAPTPTPDSAVENFENAVEALASLEDAALAQKYEALYAAALAFAQIEDKDTALASEAYADYLAFALSYNEAARAIASDIVRP